MEPPSFRIQPPAFLADPALATLLAALPGARFVGGAVRDVLAGRPIADIDLATPDPPETTASRLANAGLRAIPTGLGHGTLTALVGGQSFEITTLRCDAETDGRHARVAWTDDWREDAARRDFTINALSMTPDGAVYDYFDGAPDLAAGRVRFVGDAHRRVAEDYLRILRFFRFQARYGQGAPDPDAIAAIEGGAGGLALLSPERVWSELKRILAAPDPASSIALMAKLGILARILPEGANPARLTDLVASDAPPDPLLRLAALLDGDTEALAVRLRLSIEERDALLAIRGSPNPDSDSTDAQLRQFLADTPAAILIARTWLHQAPPELRARLAGRDALALGATPGPTIGRALAATRAWWLAGGCTADADACRADLERRLRA